MRILLLGLLILTGCGLLEPGGSRHADSSNAIYVEATLNGQPWQPDSAIGILDTPFETGDRFSHLGLRFVMNDSTPELPFYQAVLMLDLYEKPLRVDTTYYLFNAHPYYREAVANGTYAEEELGRMGRLSEHDWQIYLGSYWIAREDSLQSWVRFSRIDTVQTEPFLLVFYEGVFEVVLAPFERSADWSRYPEAKLHFRGRFGIPAVTWQYLNRCERQRNCLRTHLRDK